MISDWHFKEREKANAQLARTWKDLKKTQATGDRKSIEQAELSYFQVV